MTNQQITILENKIDKIQAIINNWETEIMNYKNLITKIKEEVSQIKTNSSITK